MKKVKNVFTEINFGSAEKQDIRKLGTKDTILWLLGLSNFSNKPLDYYFQAIDLKKKLEEIKKDSDFELEDAEFNFLKEVVTAFSPLRQGFIASDFLSLFR